MLGGADGKAYSSSWQSNARSPLGKVYTRHILRSLRVWCCPEYARGILFAHCAFDVALSPPRFPAHWLPFASFLIRLLSCVEIGLLAAVWEDLSSSFPLDLHQTTQFFDLSIFFDHCSCSNSDKLYHSTTVGPSSSPLPRTLGLLVLPTEWREGLTLQPRLQVSWLCWSFAVLVVLSRLVIYTQLLPFPPCT